MKPTHTTIAAWILAASLGAAGGLAHAQATTAAAAGKTAASAAPLAVSAPAAAAPAQAAPTVPAAPSMPAMPVGPAQQPAPAAQPALISVEQAIAAAQKQHPGSTVKDIDMEGKHGIVVYEIELESGWREYKVKVDAATGKVLTSRFEGIAWFD